MIIRFVEEARREFLDAISQYEESCAGLGARFKDEVDRCVRWIAEHPDYIVCDRVGTVESTCAYFRITFHS